MKIPGSFFEANLLLINQIIELQILKRGEIKYRASVLDFSEIESGLRDVLEDKGIYLPRKRLDFLLHELEANYMDLQDKIQKVQTKQMQHQKATKQKLSVIPSKTGVPHKILLMGGSGKTSIYKVIFEGILPHKTQILQPTAQVEKPIIDFESPGLGSNREKLNIWEAGKEFPTEEAFENTSLLLFIIDAFDIEFYEEARSDLHNAIRLIRQYGTRPQHLNADQSNIFCFIHKMDRFPDANEKFQHLVNYFNVNPESAFKERKVNFFATSIFDSSIYNAWTRVIETLMPKSSKLNELSNQLKEDLNLYACFIIEKRMGLPICASKTLLEDSALVGNTNRLLITMEKVLPEFQLANLESFKIKTATGFLEIRIFNKYFILMLLYPTTVDLSNPQSDRIIQAFITKMQQEVPLD